MASTSAVHQKERVQEQDQDQDDEQEHVRSPKPANSSNFYLLLVKLRDQNEI